MAKEAVTYANPVELTSRKLMDICSEIRAGGQLIVTGMPDGSLEFKLVMTKGDKREVTPLINRMEARLTPAPVHQTWMSPLGEPSERDTQNRAVRQHDKKVKETETEKARNSLRGGIELVLFFKDISEAVKVTMSGSEYYMFKLPGSYGDRYVYCNQDKIPYLYKDGELGKIKYL